MKRAYKSISIRLTLLFGAIATLVILILGLLIGASVQQHFLEEDMQLMSGKLHLVGNLLKKVQTPAELEALPALLDDSLVGHHNLFLQVLHPNNHILFTTSHIELPPALLQRAAIKEIPEPQTWQSETHPMRGIAALLPSAIADMPPLLVVVAVDISHHEHFMHSFKQRLWQFIILGVLVASILGWIAVRHGLSPLQDIRQGAASVTASRLNYRLDLATVPIELADLAQSLNEMLARLENSFQRLQDFSSDLAHELRTPISNLMTQTQVVLSQARTNEAYREVLASNAEEYDHLARMISDMLFLAQADNGLIVPNREWVNLAEEVRKLFDFFDALAEEKALHLSLVGNAQVQGDKLMLRRALANLLSNAIRHTNVSGTIEVRLDTRGTGITLAIENSGEGIPTEHLPRIFDRFYRADISRHGEGSGLGLAITRSIITAHGGEIVVHSAANSVCFEISIP